MILYSGELKPPGKQEALKVKLIVTIRMAQQFRTTQAQASLAWASGPLFAPFVGVFRLAPADIEVVYPLEHVEWYRVSSTTVGRIPGNSLEPRGLT